MGKNKKHSNKHKSSPASELWKMYQQNRAHTYLVQAVFMLAARDSFGLGHERLMKFYSRAKFYFEQVQQGELKLNDLLLALQEEVGIVIGPSGVRSLRGQKAPVTRNSDGIITSDENDKTDDSFEYNNPTEIKSSSLQKKLGGKVAIRRRL